MRTEALTGANDARRPGNRDGSGARLDKLWIPEPDILPPAPTFDNRIPDVAEIPVITVLAVHFSVAVLAPLFFRKWGRNAFLRFGSRTRCSFVWLLFQYGPVYSQQGAVAEVIPWIPGLHLEFAFRMDPLAWVMSLLVLVLVPWCCFYCARYFKRKDQDLRRVRRATPGLRGRHVRPGGGR
ncbi:hypothetical protein [Pseudarthrobacter equi]|uniref:hypothetical protein n=1 Tax=Pseudarthrobacter equi TaxID=728066 RepID=UPI001E54BC2A|nr:hypothetical protein [Pseudarthrobacter equi]